MPIGRPDKLRDSNAHCECSVSHPYLCGFPNPLTYARVAANRSCNWHHPTQHDPVIIGDLPIMPKPATSSRASSASESNPFTSVGRGCSFGWRIRICSLINIRSNLSGVSSSCWVAPPALFRPWSLLPPESEADGQRHESSQNDFVAVLGANRSGGAQSLVELDVATCPESGGANGNWASALSQSSSAYPSVWPRAS